MKCAVIAIYSTLHVIHSYKNKYFRNTNVHILFYVLLTLCKTLISMVDCHGEKTTKHFDQCGSHDDKKLGGLGQITDTITRFLIMNEMFWVSKYILHTCNAVLKFQQTVVTFALTV